jgi:SAM-dependent methyltransferase
MRMHISRPIRTRTQRKFWDQWHRSRKVDRIDESQCEFRQLLLDQIDLPGGATVLDLGCGQGVDAIEFSQRGLIVCGIDFSGEALRQARRLANARNVKVGLIRRSLTAPLRFPDAHFDGVYSHLGLHYFNHETTVRIFEEIWRVTRPGGLFVFSVKSTDDPYCGEGEKIEDHVYRRKGRVRHFFSPKYTQELLSRWTVDELTEREGYYASSARSRFIWAVARKPHASN